MGRSLSGDAGAIKRGVGILIQRRPEWRHYPDDPGPRAIGFFLIVDYCEQPAVTRCSAAATPLFPALISPLFLRCYFRGEPTRHGHSSYCKKVVYCLAPRPSRRRVKKRHGNSG
jgi:hypothetical protein